jgi:hypothetical protein
MTRVSVACYLRREDGAWYALGHVPEWRAAFTTFPGPADGSVWLTTEDTHVLGLRLDGRVDVAVDIIRWGQGKRLRFMTELDQEIEPGVLPSPITGRVS